MYCNGLPERNVGFIPYVQEILRILDGECLAIEPIQLNLKLGGGREMRERDIAVCVGGDVKVFEEVPREVQSRSLLHHKVGVCPQCEKDMYVVSTKKAFGKPNQACECEHCGYVDNR